MENKKKCTTCKKKKSLNEFYKATSTKDGYSYQCKLCAIDYSKDYIDSNKEACNEVKKAYEHSESGKSTKRNAQLKRRYGITLEDYDALFIKQGGCCAICGKTPAEQGRILAVDHCHSTGKVRGLLCTVCNMGIGHLGDSASRVRKALEYLVESELS